MDTRKVYTVAFVIANGKYQKMENAILKLLLELLISKAIFYIR